MAGKAAAIGEAAMGKCRPFKVAAAYINVNAAAVNMPALHSPVMGKFSRSRHWVLFFFITIFAIDAAEFVFCYFSTEPRIGSVVLYYIAT
jgi:hypothetical protein